MINRPTNIYACNGRERTTKPHIVQDGYHEWEQNGETVRGRPRYKMITSKFLPGCQYDKSNVDKKCAGCAYRNNVQN